jgi:hypothetical protein
VRVVFPTPPLPVTSTARSGRRLFKQIHAYHSRLRVRASPDGCYALGMPKDDEDIEVRCPECGVAVRVSVEKAEREHKATCPNGHEVPLAKALG